MGLTDGENSGIPATMLVGPANIGGSYPYPVYQQSGNGNNNGFGNDGWWIVLLIILLAAGGWNNNNGNGGGFGGAQPIIVNDGGGESNAIQSGFDQMQLTSGINAIQGNIYGLSTQLCNCCADTQQSLCNGFAGVNATVNSGFANAETANNARQIANMQQAFSNQTAMAQGFNNLQSQFAQCCCDNRLASADLKYTIATENCADRAAISDGIRDILTNQTASTQRILDQLCQDKIDAKNDEIANLRTQLNMANLAASQTAQTSRLLADNFAQTQALEQYLNPVPIPAYIVQNPNCCQQNTCGGCGCGGF